MPASNGVDIASLALNGAQVTSLVDVITQVGTGAMPKQTAVAVLKASFPTLSDSLIQSIIDPIQPGAIAADGTPVPVQQTEQEQRQTGSGEMMGLSTLQFNRNRKAIAKTLEDLASKTISQTQARVFLSSIGMSAENVEALITDAVDGSVDSEIGEVERNCGTGAGGFEPGNTCGSGGGGGGGGGAGKSKSKSADKFSAEGKTHGVKLPKNKKQIKIPQASQALKEMGFELDFKSSNTDLKTKVTSYKVKDKDGNEKTMTTDEIKDLVYAGVKRQLIGHSLGESGDAV
jgi:hypothetical protein